MFDLDGGHLDRWILSFALGALFVTITFHRQVYAIAIVDFSNFHDDALSDRSYIFNLFYPAVLKLGDVNHAFFTGQSSTKHPIGMMRVTRRNKFSASQCALPG